MNLMFLSDIEFQDTSGCSIVRKWLRQRLGFEDWIQGLKTNKPAKLGTLKIDKPIAPLPHPTSIMLSLSSKAMPVKGHTLRCLNV
jgi:hypothetical protein